MWLFTSISGLCVPFFLSLQCQAQSDTALIVDAYSSRIGINTFAFKQRNILQQGSFAEGKKLIYISTISDIIYNQALYSNRFVSRDVLFTSLYCSPINSYLSTGVIINAFDFRANYTQLVQSYPFLQFHWSKSRLNFNLRGGIGISSDKRLEFRNTGFMQEVNSSGQYKTKDSTWLITARVFYNAQAIAPRYNRQLHTEVQALKFFNQYANVGLRAAYHTRTVEDYQSGNIQSIRSDTVSTGFDFNYEINKHLSFRSQNDYAIPNRAFSYRLFEGNSGRQNLFYSQDEIATRQQLIAQYGSFLGTGSFEYTLRNRVYDVQNNLNLSPEELQKNLANEQLKDIKENSISWVYNLKYCMNAANTISLVTNAQLFRVDTRSELNSQDRDEVLYTGELSHDRKWSQFFRTNFRLYGAYRHFVYINASQSIENYKERILKLEPSFQYADRHFSWKGDYSLFVTYNVRDYDAELLKNRSNRIFLTTHNFQYRISPKVQVLADFIRRENRLGLFDWQRFKESPIDTVIIYDATLRGQYNVFTPQHTWSITAGYRYFRQTRSNLSGYNESSTGTITIALQNVVLQHGPKLSLSYSWKQRLFLYADCWIQWSKVFYTYQKGKEPFIGQSYSDADLGLRQRNIFPYFTVSARYRIINW